MVIFKYVDTNIEIIETDETSEQFFRKYANRLRVPIYEISRRLASRKFFARECNRGELINALVHGIETKWSPGAYYLEDIRKIMLIPDVVEDEYDLEICVVLEPIKEEEDP